MEKLLSERSVCNEKTAPYSAQQNNRAESDIGQLLWEKIWGEAVQKAVFVLNRTSKNPSELKNSYEISTRRFLRFLTTYVQEMEYLLINLQAQRVILYGIQENNQVSDVPCSVAKFQGSSSNPNLDNIDKYNIKFCLRNAKEKEEFHNCSSYTKNFKNWKTFYGKIKGFRRFG